MGPARKILGQLFWRHDPEGLEHGPWKLLARPPGALQGDLHHQVVVHRTRNSEPERQPDPGLGLLRFDRQTLGRRTRRLPTHVDAAQGAGLLGRILAGRKVFGVRIVRQVRTHLVYADRKIGKAFWRKNILVEINCYFC